MSHRLLTPQRGTWRLVRQAGALAPLGLLSLLTLVSPALAGIDLKNIADPTRPPPGMYRPAPGTPGAAGMAAAPSTSPVAAAAPAASGAASAVAAPVPRGMRLQAVRHNGPSGGGVAMIDGELIELGGRVSGGWTLSAMNSDEVWLTGPAGQRRLTLMGGDTSTDKPRAAKGRQARKE